MTSDPFKAFEQAGWEGIPGAYHDGFGSLTTQAIDPLLDAVGAMRGVRLLDVASGPGYVAAQASVRGCNVVGVDFAGAMVRDARQRFPSVDYREGDAEALAFQPESFDAVVINFGVLHLAHPEAAMSEAWRVLRPGGRFAFTVWAVPERAVAFGIVLGAIRQCGNPDVPLPPGPPFFRFSDRAQSEAALARAGFKETRVTEVPQRWTLRSPQVFFEVMLGGTVRTGGLLRAQTPAALQAIRKAVIEAASPYRKDESVELPMPAVLCSGIKPN